MKKHIAFIAFVFIAAGAQAQLANGSFEQYSSLPVNMGQWQVTPGWGNAGSVIASPDYYHYLGEVAADIPETPMAMVDAYDGSAIMGLVISGKYGTNTREYLSAGFTQSMEVGSQYLVSLRITNGEKTMTSLAGLGVDKIGMLFSVAPVIQSGQDPILQTPQFSVNGVFYSREWECINFLITADQPYANMTFGLFGNDDDKNIVIEEGADPMFAYYFVDSFSIQKVPDNYDPTVQNPSKGDHNGHPGAPPVAVNNKADEPFFVPNTFTPNGDGNNEDFKAVSNTIKDWEFEIYTKWGDRIFFTADETRGWDGSFNALNCENGSYVWQISYVEYNERDEPRKVEIRGIVNLVR